MSEVGQKAESIDPSGNVEPPLINMVKGKITLNFR
jgi:hypothetical protein